MVKFMKKNPILVVIIGLIIGVGGIIFITTGQDNLKMALLRYILAAIMFGIMILMGASKSLKKCKDGFSYEMRNCIYLLCIALFFGMIGFIPGLLNYGFSRDVLVKEVTGLIFCISVGLFEEGLFRGVVFQGILRKTGKTHKGIWTAVIISAFVFGFVHVHSYITGGSYDLMGIIQTVGKTLQTGVIGLIFAALYLKTKNIWGIALAHALNDYLLMQAAMFTTIEIGGYVSDGGMGIASVVSYAVQLLLYIPVLKKSIKIINEVKAPEYGVFEEN